MKLHHYTTIDTLALIFESKKIRFNRLTRVDDIEESELYGEINIAPYLYVSCWTTSAEENIPLWSMYTNMRGVKITFDGKPFNYRVIADSPENIMKIKGERVSPLTLEQIFAKDYLVDFSCMFDDIFGGNVEYTNDIENIYQNAVVLSEDGKHIDIASANHIAMHKRDIWRFQEEYRFNLMAYPVPEGGYNVDNLRHFQAFQRKAFMDNMTPPNDNIDVDICPDKLRNMVITMGPLTSYSDELIVRSLVDKYAPEIKIEYSNLKGKIREK